MQIKQLIGTVQKAGRQDGSRWSLSLSEPFYRRSRCAYLASNVRRLHVAVASLLLCASSGATTNLVENLNDDSSSGCLRTVIARSIAGDSITFKSGLSGTVKLSRGELVLDKDVSVEGPGAKVITLSGATQSRIFVVTNASVSISGLTIADGRATGENGVSGFPATDGGHAYGGGILNLSSTAGHTLRISECMLLGNSCFGGAGGSSGSEFTGLVGTPGAAGNAYGGAILNNDFLILVNCCFAGNRAIGGDGGAGTSGAFGGLAAGGAICNIGKLDLKNCTFATNSAVGGHGGYGGQFFGGAGGNAEGGAIFTAGQVLLESCTLVSNSNVAGLPDGMGLRAGAYGGGVRVNAGLMTAGNSIIAGNTADDVPDVSGSLVSEGFNLLGVTNGCALFGGPFDQSGNNEKPLNPRVESLQDNGGPTFTMALRSDSPSIDHGSAFGSSRDQRGAVRPSHGSRSETVGDGTDIGAFEFSWPVLNLARDGDKLVLSWPAFSVGYTLELATNLSAPNPFSSVNATGIVSTVGASRVLTNTSGPDMRRFYRLHRSEVAAGQFGIVP